MPPALILGDRLAGALGAGARCSTHAVLGSPTPITVNGYSLLVLQVYRLLHRTAVSSGFSSFSSTHCYYSSVYFDCCRELPDKGSRAMVKKFRWQEIRRKIWSPSEPPAARLFSEPQWQEHVSLGYFLYRWLIFGLWSAFIICSLFDIGSRRPEGKKETWPIYLTHWDLILGAGHTFLGAILVTRRRSLQRFASFDPDSLTLGKTEHAYWILYTLTCSIAIGVTILYWGTIYNPKIHTKDPLNYMMHLFNTVLILSDLMVVGVPLRVEHVWWPLACVIFYLIFSLFYYLAGGLDKNGYHYIYKILDWKQPGRTLLVCLGGLLFLTVVHCTLCFFVWLRSYIRAKATGAIMTTTIMTQSSNNKTGTVGWELPLPTSKSIELIV